jgi:hypothetical protein
MTDKMTLWEYKKYVLNVFPRAICERHFDEFIESGYYYYWGVVIEPKRAFPIPDILTNLDYRRSERAAWRLAYLAMKRIEDGV